MERRGLHSGSAARQRELIRKIAMLLVLAGFLNSAQFSFGAEDSLSEHFEETHFEQDESWESEAIPSVLGSCASVLQEVRFPELSPEETERFWAIEAKLRSEDWESAFSEMSGFLLLWEDRFVPGTERNLPGGTEFSGDWIWKKNGAGESAVCPRTVGEVCREWVLGLSEEGRKTWLEYADANVCTELSALGILRETASDDLSEGDVLFHGWASDVRLESIRRRNPHSSFERELLEILAASAWNEGCFEDAERFWEAELAESERLVSENVPKARILRELPSPEILRSRLAECRKLSRASRKSADRETAQRLRVSMVQVNDREGHVLFEDLLPEEQRGTLFSDRNRNLAEEMAEVPDFGALSRNTNILAVRMGTRVTFWPEGISETRPQTYLAFLDLSRDGTLLGIAAPETPRRTYVGNPLADGQFAYIPSLLLGERGEIALDILSLTDGSLVRRIPLFSIGLRDFGKETLFLPICWGSEGRIRIGGPECRVQRELKVP